MNYIKQVANMLGVEIGQEFNIILKNGRPSICNPFHFAESGLYTGEDDCTSDYLYNLILGINTIEIIPFKPKVGEKYWYCGASRIHAYESMFDPMCTADLANLKIGNCFRTGQEAETKGKELMEQLLKEYNNE